LLTYEDVMADSSAARLIVPAHVVVRELPETTVLLNAQTGRYFTLDAIGTAAWRLLRAGSPLEQVYRVLLDDYDAPDDVLRRDVDALIERLTVAGLLERNDV
jgi:hypothetical protein